MRARCVLPLIALLAGCGPSGEASRPADADAVDADSDGFAWADGDCDDSDAAVHPGAVEVCDPADIDEDCDHLADDADADATGKTTWYADEDGDGQGGPAFVDACDPPAGAKATATDCDDADAQVYAGAPEVCDGAADEDCDGAVDEAGALGERAWYPDTDSDGFGDDAAAVTACTPPPGYIAVGGDCDDARPAVHPAAVEVCGDALDDDCDPTTAC